MAEIAIKQIIEDLNDNHGNYGGYWLPKIQRNFVWTQDQICRLFDSILRGYPISSMLFWYNNENMSYRKFIQNWYDGYPTEKQYCPNDNVKKAIVLDGQQRLQSLFIGLKGSYEGRQLYINILSGTKNEASDIKYEFKFLSQNEASFPYIRFSDLVYKPAPLRTREIVKELDNEAQKVNKKLNEAELDRITDNVDLIRLSMDTKITFTLLDSINNKGLYTTDDVVEIFIRANSGGTKLSKSDLLFSLLISDWNDADVKMAELLETLNKYGYEFNRDFILKTCLVLLGKGAEYNVDKFRDGAVKQLLENNWDNFSKSIKAVVDFVHDKTYVKTDKPLTSYLALIPLIYFKYAYPDKWKTLKKADTYIIKSLLSGTFGGHSDSVINKVIDIIKQNEDFNVDIIFEELKNMGYVVNVSEDRVFNLMGYGSKYIHLIMNILYNGFNYIPALENGLPQIDHIFPRTYMKSLKLRNDNTNRLRQKYENDEINQLANCMLLTQEENGAGGKCDILPDIWFAGKSADYLEKHCIPNNPNLWKEENFAQFIEERRKLLKKKLSKYLYK